MVLVADIEKTSAFVPPTSENLRMKFLSSCRLALLGSVISLSSLSTLEAEVPAIKPTTALDDYVKTPDAAYAWKVVKTTEENDVKTTMIHLTSQTWLTESEVDRPLWEHWLVVVTPSKLVTDKAFLMIGGGGNDRKDPPGSADGMIVQIAKATGSVVAELKMVPNQPITFHKDGQARVEDDLIGYAWDKFLATGEPKWLPRLPMVKSAVRAMDCLQEFAASEQGGKREIKNFVVAGGSKRGWTTWLTGAADPRVEAIVPIVIDVANAEDSIRHHAEVYGFWAQAIGNYYQHNILQRPDHPRIKELYEIEDPISYRHRLTMPKYVVNASGDQFFCPDSSQFYFDLLQGEKNLRYVPNGDHSLKNTDAVQSIVAFYSMIIAGKKRPVLTWKYESDGSIHVTSDTKPSKVELWQAHNPKARDFRMSSIGPAYKNSELQPESDGTYVARVDKPKEGWVAYYAEFSYDVGGPFPLKLSSGIQIAPDILPFKGIDLKTVKYEAEVNPSVKAK